MSISKRLGTLVAVGTIVTVGCRAVGCADGRTCAPKSTLPNDVGTMLGTKDESGDGAVDARPDAREGEVAEGVGCEIGVGA